MYTRTRTKGTYPLTETFTGVYTRQNGVVTSVTAPYVNHGVTQTTKDNLSPKFKERSKKGQVFNNPFTTLIETYAFTRGSRTLVYNLPTPPGADTIIRITRDGNNGGYWNKNFAVLDSSTAITQAATSCLANIGRPEVEGLPFLAELKQTVEMLRNPISGITKVLARESLKKQRKGFKRPQDISVKKLKRRRAVSKDLADQHLAVMFGIKPFVMDMRAILDTLINKYGNKRSERKTARGFATALSPDLVTNSTYNDGEVTGPITGISQHSVAIRAYCLYEVKLDLGLAGDFGLSMFDIPSALWELTPWSFVVDWVSNVGDLISALTPRVDVIRLSEGYTVTTAKYSKNTFGALDDISGSYNTSAGGDTRTYVSVEKTRVPTNLGQHVGLVWDPHIGFTQLSLSLSLLTQKLSRFK